MSIESNILKKDNWFRNEDKVIEFTVFKADGDTKQSLTGWNFEFIVDDASKVNKITKTSASGIAITDEANGVLEVTVDDVDTVDLTTTKFKYELRRTDTGSEATLAHGLAFIRQARV